jgi:hypothetical protein
MPERYLSEEMIHALTNLAIWPNIVADHELCPEIRGGTVTIYYSGCGVLRDLRLQDGSVTGWINVAHVPLVAEGHPDLPLTWNAALGFQFPVSPIALPLGLGTPQVLNAYKAAAQIRPEQELLGAVLRREGNRGLILDQEIAFCRRALRIDLCYFDNRLHQLAFLELKRVDDQRLFSVGGQPPEVLNQLQNYATCLHEDEQDVLPNFRQGLQLKRKRLGLQARVAGFPEADQLQLCRRPMLGIGGCTQALVQDILQGNGGWGPLMIGLPQVAAGLYLFGNNGFQLGGVGNHMLAWDH